MLRWFLILLYILIGYNAWAKLEVVSIYPNGDNLTPTKQIVITFNKPITDFPYKSTDDFGSHVKINPDLRCNWVFLNRNTIACNIIGEAVGATTYSVTIFPSLRSYSGESLQVPHKHTFTTVRPKMLFASIRKWINTGTPVIFATFNQKVSRGSIEGNIYFIGTDNIKYPVTAEQDYSQKPELFKLKSYIKKNYPENSKIQYKAEWLIRPKQNLPDNSKFKFITEPGLESVNGNQKSIITQEMLQFKTYGKFNLLDAKCITIANKVASIMQYDEKIKCNPTMPIVLVFNNPVNLQSIIDTTYIDPKPPGMTGDTLKMTANPNNATDGSGIYEVTIYNKWNAVTEYNMIINHDSRFILSRWLTNSIRAINKNYGIQYLAHDEFEQTLPATINIRFQTGNANPDIKIPDHYIIMDSTLSGNNISLDTTNIQSLTYDYHLITTPDLVPQQSSVNIKIKNSGKNKIIPGIFSSESIFHNKSGAAYGQITSFPRIERDTYMDTLFTESTPFSLNADICGNNLVVTLFHRKTLEIPDGATIYLARWNWKQNEKKTVLNSAQTKEGTAIIEFPENLWSEKKDLYLIAQYKDDIAILPLTDRFERGEMIEASPIKLMSWGITDKVIYRPGESFRYKIYIRSKLPDMENKYKNYNYHLKLVDPLGTVIYEQQNITLSEYGSIDGAIAIPQKSPRGKYNILIYSDKIQKGFLTPLSLYIDNYNTAYSDIKTELNSKLFTAKDEMKVKITGWLLHDQSPLTDLKVSARVTLRATEYIPSDELLRNFIFTPYEGNYDTANIDYLEGVLDNTGSVILTRELYKTNDLTINHGIITVTTLLQDISGKYIASQETAEFFKTDQLVGIKINDSIFSPKENIRVNVAVTDTHGKMTDKTPIYVTVDYAENENNNKKWKKQKAFKLNSSENDISTEDISFNKIGKYRITAEISNGHKSYTYFYITENNSNHHPTPPITDEKPVRSVKDAYVVGETAQYIVYNPYEDSEAIFVLSNNKIIDVFKHKLAKGASVINIDMLPRHAPGFNLNINIINNKADNYAPSITTRVIDNNLKINLTAKLENKVYKNNETVSVTLNSNYHKQTEATLIVVDMATLNVAPSYLKDYNIYQYFNSLTNISSRHFALFAVPDLSITPRLMQDRGEASASAQYAEVAYWNPSIILEPNVDTIISFPNPGKNTNWAVIAIAADADTALGCAETAFMSRKDVEVYTALPNNVVNGDKFQTYFTVHNKSKVAQNLNIEIAAGKQSPTIQKHTLQPGEHTVITQDYTASHDDINIGLSVKNGDANIYNNRYQIKVISGVQKKTDALYGILNKVTENTLNYKDSQYSTLLMEAFRPLYYKIKESAEKALRQNQSIHYQTAKKPPWGNQLLIALATALKTSTEFHLHDYYSDVIPEVQDILFSLSAYQSPTGGILPYETADPQSQITAEMTVFTLAQLNKLKSIGYLMGYIVPPDIESKMIAYLTEYYENNKHTPMQVKLLTMIAYTVKNLDTKPLKNYIGMMDLGTLSYYLGTIDKTSDEARSILDMILGSGFSAPGIISFFNAQPTNIHFINNCKTIEILQNYISNDHLANLVRYVSNSLPSWFNLEHISCLTDLYLYANKYEQEGRKAVSFYLNKDLLLNDSLANDLIVSDSLAKHKTKTVQYMIEQTEGLGMTNYMIKTLTDTAPADSENKGIAVTKKFSLVNGNSLKPIDSPFNIKIGDIVKTEIIINSSLPLAKVNLTEYVPGCMEILSTPITLNDSKESNHVYINLLSTSYTLDGPAIVVPDLTLETNYTYNIYYFSYAKIPGYFTAPAAIAKAENMEIFGYNNNLRFVVHPS